MVDAFNRWESPRTRRLDSLIAPKVLGENGGGNSVPQSLSSVDDSSIGHIMARRLSSAEGRMSGNRNLPEA